MGSTNTDHIKALEEVLSKLEIAGPWLKKSEYFLMASSAIYLGQKLMLQRKYEQTIQTIAEVHALTGIRTH